MNNKIVEMVRLKFQRSIARTGYPNTAANMDLISHKFGHLLENYIDVKEKKSIYPSVSLSKSKLRVLFPLKEHPIHGKTGLDALEIYDEQGFVTEYHYQWKSIIPKQGIIFSHISAWENEPHNLSETPLDFIVESEPHHHHYIPGERHHRQDNWDVWTLQEAFEFIEFYIESGNEYIP